MFNTTQSERFPPKSATERVYQQIKVDIINGVYPPGAHLVRTVMAKRYGVSPIPILEACYRLERDGLVENSPQLGTHVVEFSEDILQEDLILREAIECMVARLFVKRASREDKKQVGELAEFIDTVEEKLIEEKMENRPELFQLFQKQHSEFHIAIAKLSKATSLYGQMKRLWYRRYMAAGDIHHFLFPVPKGWHSDLAKALAGDDPDAAEKEMRRHLTHKTDHLGDSVKEILTRGRSELLDILSENGKAESEA